MVVAALVLVTDLRGAIGFSSFCVLAYDAIANASAWTLPRERRRRQRAVAGVGFLGCAVLAGTLPLPSVVSGASILAVGALAWLARRRHRRRGAQDGSPGRTGGRGGT